MPPQFGNWGAEEDGWDFEKVQDLVHRLRPMVQAWGSTSLVTNEAGPSPFVVSVNFVNVDFVTGFII